MEDIILEKNDLRIIRGKLFYGKNLKNLIETQEILQIASYIEVKNEIPYQLGRITGISSKGFMGMLASFIWFIVLVFTILYLIGNGGTAPQGEERIAALASLLLFWPIFSYLCKHREKNFLFTIKAFTNWAKGGRTIYSEILNSENKEDIYNKTGGLEDKIKSAIIVSQSKTQTG